MSYAISVEDLGKRYELGVDRHSRLADALVARLRGRRPPTRETLWALRDVSFTVEQGEVLGIIGRNGSGKSTLLKVLSRITTPTEGTARLRGRVSSLLEVGTGFHPDLSGRDNILLNGSVLGMKRREILSRFDDIVEFSGLAGFLDTPVKRYSSGMFVRLAFAVAAHLDTEIMLVDEVLAVGDLEFQRRCLGKMGDVARSGRTVIFVSHDLAAVSALCRRGIVLDGGRLVVDADVHDAVATYTRLQTSSTSSDLEHRTDRQGAGGLRATSAHVEGRDGTPTDTLVVGHPATLAVSYEHRDGTAGGPLDVALGIYNELGHPVTDVWSASAGYELTASAGRGEVRCSFPKLQLNTGRYSFNITLRRRGVLEDSVGSACTFDVVRGDYFGTGKLSTQGDVVLDQQWSAREATAHVEDDADTT